MASDNSKKRILKNLDVLRTQVGQVVGQIKAKESLLREIDILKQQIEKKRSVEWKLRGFDKNARKELERISHAVSVFVAEDKKQRRSLGAFMIFMSVFISLAAAGQYVSQQGHLQPGMLPSPINSLETEQTIFILIMGLTWSIIPIGFCLFFFLVIDEPFLRNLEKYNPSFQRAPKTIPEYFIGCFTGLVYLVGALLNFSLYFGIPFVLSGFPLYYIYPIVYPSLVALLRGGVPVDVTIVTTVFLILGDVATLVTLISAIVIVCKAIYKRFRRNHRSN